MLEVIKMQSLPDMNELRKLAASPAGQQLLSKLKNSNLNLAQLSRDASAGNIDQLQKQLSGLLNAEDAQKLLKQLEMQL